MCVRKNILTFLFVGFVFLSLNSFAATTYYVSTNSPANGPGTAWSNAFHTIQAAVDVANDGDTILVTNGVYSSGGAVFEGMQLLNRVCINKQITVSSVNGASNTVIVGAADTGGFGANATRCALVASNAVLSGFTLTGGYTDYTTETNEDNITNIYDLVGGGVVLYGNYSTISNCIITNCHAFNAGGGVLCFNYSIVNHCMIAGNSADNGAGVYLHNESGTADLQVAVIKDSLITNNIALTGGYDSGGGIYSEQGGWIQECEIVGNTAGIGGGIYFDNGGYVVDSMIDGNNATNYGAGIYMDYGGNVSDSMISGNAATNSGGGIMIDGDGNVTNDVTVCNNSAGQGGGILLNDGGYIDDVDIVSNQALTAGGFALENNGIICNCRVGYNFAWNDNSAASINGNNNSLVSNLYVYCNQNDNGGSIMSVAGTKCYNIFAVSNNASSVIYFDNSGEMYNSVISNNNATGISFYQGGIVKDSVSCYNEGGGAYLYYGGELWNSRIKGNTNEYEGAGIKCMYGGKVVNCLVTDNRTLNTSVWGAGIYAYNGGEIYHCTVVGNSTPNAEAAGGVYLHNWNGSTPPHMYNSIAYYNTGGNAKFNGTTMFSCCAPDLIDGNNGCVTNPPGFMNRNAQDYHLRFDSPCIDTPYAYHWISTDLDGNPRFMDGNNDGTNYSDMGCFEYNSAVTDSDGDGLMDATEVAMGINPGSTNTDGDCMGDYAEWVAGTDGADSNSYFEITAISNNAVYFYSLTNRVYKLQGKDSLMTGYWNDVVGAGPRYGIGGVDYLVDTNAVLHNFYRVDVSLIE